MQEQQQEQSACSPGAQQCCWGGPVRCFCASGRRSSFLTDPRYCELTELLVVPCLQPGHKKQEERSQPPAGTSKLLLQLCWQEHRLQGSTNLLEARMEQRLHRASSPSLLSIFSSDPRSCASSRCPRSPLGEKLCQGDSSTRLLAGNTTDCSDSGSVSVREVEDLLYRVLRLLFVSADKTLL